MHMSYRDLGEHKVIKLKGEMDYMAVRELKDAILKLIHDNTKSIVLDLKEVYFMDSAGMGMLVSVNKEMIGNNINFGLMNVSDDVFDLLKLATVDAIIKIYNSEDELE